MIDAADVERADLRALRARRDARNRHVGIETEKRVEALVRVESGLDLGLRPGDVLLRVRDGQNLDLARAEHLLDPRGALLQAGVARLVDDDEDLLRSHLLELLAGALAGDALRLSDMDHVVGERVERAEARVDGDDLDAFRRGLPQWIP